MENIVYMFIGSKDIAKATDFMLHFVQSANNQYSYQNCWVVINDNQVVAAANVYDGAQLNELRQPVIEHIRSEFNPDIKLEDETQAGELYIDSIAVNTSQRNRGFGSMLLQFLIDEYASKQRKTLGLLVDEENPNARRLYLKMGFKTVRRKIFFGKSMEHLQCKYLKQPLKSASKQLGRTWEQLAVIPLISSYRAGQYSGSAEQQMSNSLYI